MPGLHFLRPRRNFNGSLPKVVQFGSVPALRQYYDITTYLILLAAFGLLNFANVMQDRKFKRQIARLERVGNDDFQLILTGGAGAFATHELHLLLRRIRVRSRQVSRLRRTMFKVGLCIPFLMFAACAAALVSLRGLVAIFILAIPVCLIILVYQQVRAGRKFSCYNRAKRLRAIIQQELARRR